ncbi:MAG: hypothetical protein LBV12_03930, partial [Puniceicoccales bacterium]|nr:hypothetical protein [Puniceicoccales bacterium]
SEKYKAKKARIDEVVPLCEEALGARMVSLLCRRLEGKSAFGESTFLRQVFPKYREQLTEEQIRQVFQILVWRGILINERGIDDTKLKALAEKKADRSADAARLYDELRKALPEPVRMAKGKLTVRVVDEAGNPMDRVQVYFSNFKDAQGSPTGLIYRKTDADGRVTLEQETSSLGGTIMLMRYLNVEKKPTGYGIGGAIIRIGATTTDLKANRRRGGGNRRARR